jgi:hypothetical protein
METEEKKRREEKGEKEKRPPHPLTYTRATSRRRAHQEISNATKKNDIWPPLDHRRVPSHASTHNTCFILFVITC